MTAAALNLHRPRVDTPGWVIQAREGQRRQDALDRFARQGQAATDAWAAGDGTHAADLAIELCSTIDVPDFEPRMLDLIVRAVTWTNKQIPEPQYTHQFELPPQPDPSFGDLTLRLYNAGQSAMQRILDDQDRFGFARWCLDEPLIALSGLRRHIAHMACDPHIGALVDATWKARELGGLVGHFDVTVSTTTTNRHLLASDETRTLCGRKLAAGWNIEDHCASSRVDCARCAERRASGREVARRRDRRSWHAYRLTQSARLWAQDPLSDLLDAPAQATWPELYTPARRGACDGAARALAQLISAGPTPIFRDDDPLPAQLRDVLMRADGDDPDTPRLLLAAITASDLDVR